VKSAPSTTARRDSDDNDYDNDDHRPKEFPRGVKTKHNSPAGGDEKAKVGAGALAGVLSMAQRVMMEAERGSAIRRHREMKERKTKTS
jgi:hypothetical protein